MSYILLLLWLCLKPYWWAFLLAGAFSALAGYCYYKDLMGLTILFTGIASPCILLCLYLIIRVLNEINGPW